MLIILQIIAITNRKGYVRLRYPSTKGGGKPGLCRRSLLLKCRGGGKPHPYISRLHWNLCLALIFHDIQIWCRGRGKPQCKGGGKPRPYISRLLRPLHILYTRPYLQIF